MGNPIRELKNNFVKLGKKIVENTASIIGIKNQTCAGCMNIFSSE